VSTRLDVFDELSDIDAANVVRCARVLLRRPLLRTGGPDGDLLPLVHRYRAALTELFSSLLGYRLVVERRFARLYKAGPGPDPTRGESGMSPRGYAYLALTLAVLTGIGQQVLLSRLVADVRSAAVEAGIEVVDDLADRRALTAALRHLVALGVISETEGSVATWTGEGPAEALITVNTDLLGRLVSGPLAEAGSPEELVDLAARPGARGVEHAVRRRLVEDPVVHYADLSPEQAEWLRRRQRQESLLLERYFGLVTESRLEGVLAADPEEYLSDVTFPGPSTVARIALLALPELLTAGEHTDGVADTDHDTAGEDPDDENRDGHTGPGGAGRVDGRVPVRLEQVRAVCARLLEQHPAAWSRQASEDVDTLTTEVLDLLTATGLARREADGLWWLSPAAYRWLPEPDDTPSRPVPAPAAPEPEPASWSLFDGPADLGGAAGPSTALEQDQEGAP